MRLRKQIKTSHMFHPEYMPKNIVKVVLKFAYNYENED